ncbi:MAG: hemerythrin domain-containing protein [Tatlockia sp.]|nr:hemerythrin domain-containing protein [Tatlockia sp.]
MNNSHVDIFTILKTDHRKHRELLNLIESAVKNPVKCQQLLQEFSLEVKAHASAEEQSFYATLMKKPAFTDQTRHSVAEHKDIEDMLDELEALDINNPEWLEQFNSLKKEYLHHIDEEEKDVFPKASESLSREDQQDMCELFKKRKIIEKNND